MGKKSLNKSEPLPELSSIVNEIFGMFKKDKEVPASTRPKKPGSELRRFVEDYIKGTTNPFISSMFDRMIRNKTFTKRLPQGGDKQFYNLSPEEIAKLDEIEPLLRDLERKVEDILSKTKMS